MRVLEVQGLHVRYGKRAAVHDVSLGVARGELLSLVGGSGAGKSTIAHAVAGLVAPSGGAILVNGVDLLAAPRRAQRALRLPLQLILQDPYSSLPNHLRVRSIVAEPLLVHRLGDRARRVAAALDAVGLPPREFAERYPHQLSGGQRQRVALARALVTDPAVLIADEPTAMLDATLRAGMTDLLKRLADERGLAVLHITHDLAMARRISDRIAVMHRGAIVEQGPAHQVLIAPEHPYTHALITAATRHQGGNRDQVRPAGDVPAARAIAS
ncbi:ABC transporter ATP-binding protein [Hoyosella sp. G463]|uniref:ABC transporter ATP-binding protein n=1 Tax=Lolliginicoccus lacisalsi TaxID=2742202 RepID=A0A927J9N6_9ACTN|nr:ABC transporter ATP-binding protein [Lolliginicoccus lacisalsi]MBD8505153.1 ABC transporter ATP-binding protein [Lolliginicoccus lacisalsi]